LSDADAGPQQCGKNCDGRQSSIFTEEQIWDLIAYMYSFQFEYQY
jgi:hypothetical protein